MRADVILLIVVTTAGFVVGGAIDRFACRRRDVAVDPLAVPGLVAGFATAASWALLGWHFGASWTLVVGVVSSTALVALSAADIRCRRLPKAWCHTAAVGAVAVMGLASVGTGQWEPLMDAFLSGTLAWSAFYCVWRVSAHGRFGRGDVRLAFMVGACSGWVGTPRTAVLLVALSLAGSCVGGIVTATGAMWRLRSSAVLVPLGPSLAGAALGTMVWGPAVLRLAGF